MLPFSLCVRLAAWRQIEIRWSHLSNVVRVCAPAAGPDGIGGMMAVFLPYSFELHLNSSNEVVRIYMRNKFSQNEGRREVVVPEVRLSRDLAPGSFEVSFIDVKIPEESNSFSHYHF